MPANLGGVEACEKIFKGVPNVGVFDTAFHIATMPDCAGMYAIDPKYYKKMGIRKYGFHGTSYKFITQAAAKFHMGPWGVGKEYSESEFRAAMKAFAPQIIATHTADWYAAEVDEREVEG